jgi:hypothetical protein
VLLACVVGGLLVPAYFLGVADVSHLAWDFRAYYTAAEAALNGESFVGVHSGLPGVSYVYPPVSVALFLPHAVVGGWQLSFALQTALNICAAVALAGLVVHTVETRRGRLPTTDRLAIVGFCVASAPAMAVLGQGQVDLLIAVALAGAFLAVETGRGGVAGAALGGAALVKVFPAALGLWLVWRRAWRALAAAILTGVSGLVGGALVFGVGAYRRYLDVLAGRSRVAEFGGTVSPDFFAMTLFRPLSQLLPNVDPVLYVPLSVLAVGPVAAFVAFRGRGFAGRLTTYLVAIVAMLVVSPASNALYVVYAYFPLLCLLYLGGQRGRTALLAGTAAVAFPLQPAQVGATLALVGVPPAVSAPLLGAVTTVLTVVSLPLAGLLVILGWCAVQTTRGRERPTTDIAPARAD